MNGAYHRAYLTLRRDLFLSARRLAWEARIVGWEDGLVIHPARAILMQASAQALRAALTIGTLFAKPNAGEKEPDKNHEGTVYKPLGCGVWVNPLLFPCG